MSVSPHSMSERYTPGMTTRVMVKVSEQTRRRLKAHTQSGRTADQVISAALDALEGSQRRELMRRQSSELAADPQDRAAVAEVMSDMEALRAW